MKNITLKFTQPAELYFEVEDKRLFDAIWDNNECSTCQFHSEDGCSLMNKDQPCIKEFYIRLWRDEAAAK